MPDHRSTILFANAAYEALEPPKSLGAKYQRLLKRLRLDQRVQGKRVGIKMHFGGDTGYSTIPPFFVRELVHACWDAGAKHVKAMDNNPADGLARGYTREVLGCDLVSCFGASGKYLHPQTIDYKTLDSVEFGGEALDCDFFIDLSHVKGHGACGFGGALKNIAMGVTPGRSRAKLHGLEGGIAYDPEKCTFCGKCHRACTHHAITMNQEKKQVEIFFHNCNFCQHCVMVCPEGAVVMEDRKFDDFSRGMALVTSSFLKNFDPQDILFINVLLNITIYCDCWGMTTPALVPDIGILASDDLVAIDWASLDLINREPLMEKGLPAGFELREDAGHLFEKIHGKDPYLMVQYLKEVYGGSSEYDLQEVR